MQQQHWHVEDHYTGDARLYPVDQRSAMRQWVYRHGGSDIVAVELCSEQCLDQIGDDEK